jgi:hypothetical protein
VRERERELALTQRKHWPHAEQRERAGAHTET